MRFAAAGRIDPLINSRVHKPKDAAEQLELTLAPHAEKLITLNREADFQRQAFSARQAAHNSRAAILIGAASVASAVHFSQHAEATQVTAAIFAGIAALFGVFTLLPRIGRDISVAGPLDELYVTAANTMNLNLLNAKLKVQAIDEKASK
jgi:hypothetical protein